MKQKVLFIYNPSSGQKQIKNYLFNILNKLAEKQYIISIYPTTKQGDAYEIIKKRDKDFSFIICSGGDGTLDEVVSGMIASGFDSPIGYIPSGSTNDFGNSLGIPKDMLKAIDIILEKKSFKCDIGQFNNNIFVYVAAFGAFTQVSYETPQDLKNSIGHSAYILEGIKSISNIKPYNMKITYDNGIIEGDFIFGMITNSMSVGGIKNYLNKDIILDDGLFEVVLVKNPKNPLELNNILMSLLNIGTTSNQVFCFRTKKIKIETKEFIPWTLDGENGGIHKDVNIINLNKKLEIYR